MNRALSIFVLHPSRLLTDHRGNGDGLIAHGFIEGLALRGHTLHVAYETADLARPLPERVRLHHIPLLAKTEGLRRIEYMLRVRLLYERLRSRHRFDVVHQMNPVFTPLSLALAGCRTPLVLGTYIPHWPDPSRSTVRNAARYGALCRAQQALAARLLVTTPAALQRIDPSNSIRAKVRYVGHAVDSRLLDVPDARVPNAPPEVLFIGSMMEKKGVFDLLRAFERVLVACPDARLRLIGEGEAIERVRREAAHAGGPEARITVQGPVDRTLIPGFISRCDVFCLPSHGEPFGMAVLEAMACGKPVVTTDAGGFPHLVPREGGICVPQRDPESLSAALVRILRSRELQERMGACNRAVVAARYTWEHVLDKLEIAYEDALGAPAIQSAAVVASAAAIEHEALL